MISAVPDDPALGVVARSHKLSPVLPTYPYTPKPTY